MHAENDRDQIEDARGRGERLRVSAQSNAPTGKKSISGIVQVFIRWKLTSRCLHRSPRRETTESDEPSIE